TRLNDQEQAQGDEHGHDPTGTARQGPPAGRRQRAGRQQCSAPSPAPSPGAGGTGVAPRRGKRRARLAVATLLLLGAGTGFAWAEYTGTDLRATAEKAGTDLRATLTDAWHRLTASDVPEGFAMTNGRVEPRRRSTWWS